MPVIGVLLAGNSTAPFAEFPSIIPGQGREGQGKDRRGGMAEIERNAMNASEMGNSVKLSMQVGSKSHFPA